VEASLFHNLLATEPILRLFSHTPAQSAIDLAARAFPVFQPPPILEDRAPLSVAPKLALGPSTGNGLPLAVLGLVCVTASAGVVGWASRPFSGQRKAPLTRVGEPAPADETDGPPGSDQTPAQRAGRT
jgi:nitrous oxidase accessory protein